MARLDSGSAVTDDVVGDDAFDVRTKTRAQIFGRAECAALVEVLQKEMVLRAGNVSRRPGPSVRLHRGSARAPARRATASPRRLRAPTHRRCRSPFPDAARRETRLPCAAPQQLKSDAPQQPISRSRHRGRRRRRGQASAITTTAGWQTFQGPDRGDDLLSAGDAVAAEGLGQHLDVWKRVPSVRSGFWPRQIAIEMRVHRTGDVPRLPLALAPRHIIELETAVHDDEIRIGEACRRRRRLRRVF